MKKKLLFILFVLQPLFITVLSAAHLKNHILISAKIDGMQQVPSVNTTAMGVAGFTLNASRDSLCITVGFTGLSGPLAAAHIHEGASGTNGGVLVDLSPFINGNRINTVITGSALTPSLISKLLSGQCYINLHTAQFPNGEIRGQLMIESDHSFRVLMDGSQEVPAVTTNAFGVGYFDLSKDLSKIKFYVVMQNLTSPLTGAHLHNGMAGMSGGVVVDLTSSITGNVLQGVINNPPQMLVDDMFSGGIYLNVHNASFPGGEIRGQLINSQQYLYFNTIITGSQQVPAITTMALGTGSMILNTTFDSLWIDVAATDLSGVIVAAHFHSGNPGVNGGVEVDLTSMINGNRISGLLSGAMLTADILNKLTRGEIYINLHTAANPNGEIRGQVYRLYREGYTIELDGSQEVPSVSTNGSGTGVVSIDRDQDNAHFMISSDGLSASGAHFHKAVEGQNGPVVFDLTPFYNNNFIAGYWKSTDATPFTVANSVQFRNDSIYVNLHTTANPNGEIRGQVKRGYYCMNMTTGLSQTTALSFNAALSIYPNPASSLVSLKVNDDAFVLSKVIITDYTGRILINMNLGGAATASEAAIDLSGFADGAYWITVITSTGIQHSSVLSKVTSGSY